MKEVIEQANDSSENDVEYQFLDKYSFNYRNYFQPIQTDLKFVSALIFASSVSNKAGEIIACNFQTLPVAKYWPG